MALLTRNFLRALLPIPRSPPTIYFESAAVGNTMVTFKSAITSLANVGYYFSKDKARADHVLARRALKVLRTEVGLNKDATDAEIQDHLGTTWAPC